MCRRKGGCFLDKQREKAILVALDPGREEEAFQRELDELALLAVSAGAVVVATFVQQRRAPDPARYVGRGKGEEIAAAAEHLGADLVVFNDELSPTQIRNLDRSLKRRVIDRTALILDIFARRALSREGKLQVELAQMKYLLPRLVGLGSSLSRLGGGIGTRGPGETQLEVDRRVIRKRIAELEKETIALRRHRSLHRKRRSRSRLPMVSLAGYTNAGKSTLLNSLTGADSPAGDMLFATLDPLVRKTFLRENTPVLFADTVGFIEKLPRQLISAFQATLEEIAAADVVLHVADLSHPDLFNQVHVVREHLSLIDNSLLEKEILVFNKLDRIREGEFIKKLQHNYPGALFLSALEKRNLDLLHSRLLSFLHRNRVRLTIELPYSKGKLYAEIQGKGKVLDEQTMEETALLDILVEPDLAARLEKYRLQQ